MRRAPANNTQIITMAEPLSSSQSQSTTAQLDAEDLPPTITNAEDRKAAAALSSLDARGDDDYDDYDNGKAGGGGGGKGVNNNIDQEALGRAISRLEITTNAGAGAGGGGKGGGEGKSTKGRDGGDDKSGSKGKEKESDGLLLLKKVKVDQNDVALLVSQKPDSLLLLPFCCSTYQEKRKKRGEGARERA